MADKDKKAPIIIIKKIVGGGHGHHGGAWKVAYADFVTAMMAFFLVMWLMGSDEETKAAIAHYFNHPNSPFHEGKDPNSDIAHPLGEQVGQGETLLSGLDGLNPDDLVPNPVKAESYLQQHGQIAELLREEMDGHAFGIQAKVEYLKFSIPESVLFNSKSRTFKKGAEDYLNRIGRMIEGYKGFLTIEDHTNDELMEGSQLANKSEASVLRAVAIKDYLKEGKWFPDEKIITPLLEQNEKQSHENSSDGSQEIRRIEFILSHQMIYKKSK